MDSKAYEKKTNFGLFRMSLESLQRQWNIDNEFLEKLGSKMKLKINSRPFSSVKNEIDEEAIQRFASSFVVCNQCNTAFEIEDGCVQCPKCENGDLLT